MENGKSKTNSDIFDFPFSIFHFFCLSLFLLFSTSCRSAPTDLRSLAPADALVYLETNDLRKTLEALSENEAFKEAAAREPDFSALDGVQFAVAVTGFETSEEPAADERAALNFKPRFVAIADTHRFKPTAVAIAESQIGRYARGIYGSDAKLEKSARANAEFFVWTSRDGRKIFAAVAGGVIYFGNDESVINECLEIERGAAESLLKNENLARAREAASDKNEIAFGYVSPEGVAQIGNLAAVSFAVGASENGDARAFIAGAAPQIIRKSVKEISWTATKNGRGVEDSISISLDGETAAVLKETLKPSAINAQTDSAEFLPPDVLTATRYNLQNPQTAWRGLLFAAEKHADAEGAKILAQASNGLLEPYGISDAETFLSAVDSSVLTARFGGDEEKSIAVFAVKDAEKIKKSIAQINFKAKPEKLQNADVWKSEDGETIAAFAADKLILGDDADAVRQCLEAKRNGRGLTGNQLFQKFAESKSVAVTFTRDADAAEKIVEILGETKEENKSAATVYLTETDFTETGIVRRSVSAFGLIGTILETLEN